MKKISFLITGCLLVLISSASARQPQVILNTGYNYEIKVDGNFYAGGSVPLPYLNQGLHNVEVYEVNRTGILVNVRKRVLIYSSSFVLRNNDVMIEVNNNGQVRVFEYSYNLPVAQPDYGNNNNGNWRNNQDVYRNGTGNNSCNNKGNNSRGNQYGHYKKMKHNNDNDYNGGDYNRQNRNDGRRANDDN